MSSANVVSAPNFFDGNIGDAKGWLVFGCPWIRDGVSCWSHNSCVSQGCSSIHYHAGKRGVKGVFIADVLPTGNPSWPGKWSTLLKVDIIFLVGTFAAQSVMEYEVFLIILCPSNLKGLSKCGFIYNQTWKWRI